MNDKPCPLCNDSRYILGEDGSVKKCKCQLTAEIKAYLPEFLNKYKIVKQAFEFDKFKDKNLYISASLPVFGTFANTYLAYAYFKAHKPTYQILTVSKLTELFFSTETREVDDAYKVDILFLMLYAGYNNKFTPQTVLDIIKTRLLYNLPTIFFVDNTEFTSDAKIRDRLGDDVYNLLTSKTFTKVGK